MVLNKKQIHQNSEKHDVSNASSRKFNVKKTNYEAKARNIFFNFTANELL